MLCKLRAFKENLCVAHGQLAQVGNVRVADGNGEHLFAQSVTVTGAADICRHHRLYVRLGIRRICVVVSAPKRINYSLKLRYLGHIFIFEFHRGLAAVE